MNVLFTGIYSLFKTPTTHAFYIAIGGRLYLGKAPQGAAFPYCVFNMVSDVPNPSFNEIEEENWIQFSIYSEKNNASEAGTVLAALYTRYDYCTLSVTGYNFISMARESTVENNDFSRDPAIFGYVANYIVKVQKSR